MKEDIYSLFNKLVVKPILNNENPKRIVERTVNEKNKETYIQAWDVFDNIISIYLIICIEINMKVS
ncbi:MAG: hypothetical protein RR657_07140 [Peptostreptococcaceae bacterium]